MSEASWLDIGAAETLRATPLTQVVIGRLRLAVSHRDGAFGVVSGVCSHAGGPLGDGALDGEYITCPWHHWKFHRITGAGEPGYEDDAVPRYDVRVGGGRVEVDVASATKRSRKTHAPHPLARKVAAFLITGGQDNVQQVAGHLLGFFGEIGFRFPQFPYVAHSRGWTAEDMESNVRFAQGSAELREGTEQLTARAVDHALLMLDHQDAPHLTSRGGRKAHRMARPDPDPDSAGG